MKDDRLISLNAAIDILEHKKDKNAKGDIGGFYNKIIQNDIDALMQLPPVQPSATDTNVGGNLIDRQAALEALAEAMPSLTTPDGRGQFDHDIHVTDEAYVDCMQIIHELPSAQPGWIPWDSGRFPEESGTYTVTAYDGATKRVTYAKYQKRLKRWELTGARAYWRVLAWMPHIEPWEGGQENGID